MKEPIDARITGSGYGFVYVMSYPGSDKVKIGHSLDPNSRAVDIGGTLAPEEPVVEAYYWCAERRQDVERRAHLIRTLERANGEWFRISVSAALTTIEQAAKDVGVPIQLAYSKFNTTRQFTVNEAVKIAEKNIKATIEEAYQREIAGLKSKPFV